MKSVTGYVSEVREELSKVTWPKRKEVIKLTSTVVAITLLVGVFVGALDYIFARLLELIII